MHTITIGATVPHMHILTMGAHAHAHIGSPTFGTECHIYGVEAHVRNVQGHWISVLRCFLRFESATGGGGSEVGGSPQRLAGSNSNKKNRREKLQRE